MFIIFWWAWGIPYIDTSFSKALTKFKSKFLDLASSNSKLYNLEGSWITPSLSISNRLSKSCNPLLDSSPITSFILSYTTCPVTSLSFSKKLLSKFWAKPESTFFWIWLPTGISLVVLVGKFCCNFQPPLFKSIGFSAKSFFIVPSELWVTVGTGEPTLTPSKVTTSSVSVSFILVSKVSSGPPFTNPGINTAWEYFK